MRNVVIDGVMSYAQSIIFLSSLSIPCSNSRMVRFALAQYNWAQIMSFNLLVCYNSAFS